MKNFYTFAANNILEGDQVRLSVAGFFYTPLLNINGVTPVRNRNEIAALEVLFNGSVAPFFCYHEQTNAF
jgi:hypothetical protein